MFWSAKANLAISRPPLLSFDQSEEKHPMHCRSAQIVERAVIYRQNKRWWPRRNETRQGCHITTSMTS